MMKKAVTMMLFLLAGVVGWAQEDTFTDEELTTYASVMVWAENEKAALSSVVSDSVAIWLENTDLTNAQYNELSKADKKGELESVEATEAQVAVYTAIRNRIDDKAAKFKERYVSRIKDDIGAGLYNKVKTALKKDEAVKARYNEIYAQLQTESSEQEESTGDTE